MSVHHEITKHSQKQHSIVKEFIELDQQRESYIEEAINNCKANLPFSVDNINKTTMKINELAKNGIIPIRKLVTPEMVSDYVKKISM